MKWAMLVSVVVAMFSWSAVWADAGGGPRSPTPTEVLRCRGECAAVSLACLRPCLPTSKPGSADCITACHDALDSCYRGCGTYPGDTRPEPPPRKAASTAAALAPVCDAADPDGDPCAAPAQVCPPGERDYTWDCAASMQCDSGAGPEWMRMTLRVMAYDELGARAGAAADAGAATRPCALHDALGELPDGWAGQLGG
jgi:hypothetical protein